MKYRIVVVIVVAGLLVAGGLWYFRPKPTLAFSADFTQADGVYPGNKVTILGVPVGTVTAVEPRGATVRVSMALPADTKIPDNAQAWIAAPSVISEKNVELTPAYRGGGLLAGGAVIPAERTHSPLSWDSLMSSVDTLLTALGSDGGATGKVLHAGATLLDGNGAKVRDALRNISQASGVLTSNGDDTTKLLSSLQQLVQLITDNKSTVDSVTTSVTQAAQLFAGQRDQIADTIDRLSGLLTQVSDLVDRHGAPLTADLQQLSQLSSTILAHQQALTEVLDTAPLAFGNFDRAVTPDHRLRIRLDLSTNLSQVPLTQDLCARFPIPLCNGPGIVNPVPIPPDVTQALGIDSVLGGGK
ncbi:MCE family protein [Amycolatopsis acidicola]|uniref:MCE family protein n=1 Tax=Amycolatopsis acidicola TaxID=2596893 RepID=A0A5N0USZ9_9PSEU|nr:MCE family protein [Amycolatopsis acidicola]KAA9151160.1 MCE family protein [Amycolatopsis acidicola]